MRLMLSATVRRVVVTLLGVVVAVAALWAVGTVNPPQAPVLQGDRLGPEDGEENYTQRADDTLRTADEPAFALVMFDSAQSAHDAAEAVAQVQRVNAIVAGGAAPIAIGEPPAGQSRATIFQRATPQPIDTVIAYGTGDQLRAVAKQPAVLTVEVLPSDAVWGAFTLTRNAIEGRV